MPAACWACRYGFANADDGPIPRDALGVCTKCGLLACEGHGERDRTSKRWVCIPSIAGLLATSAGIDDESELDEMPRVRDRADFARRFPRTNRLIEPARAAVDPGPVRQRATDPASADLLQDAVVLAVVLLRSQQRDGLRGFDATSRAIDPEELLGIGLARVVTETAW